MEFSRQEYWSGLPFPSPVDLPDPGIEPTSPALQADALTSEPSGKPKGGFKQLRIREGRGYRNKRNDQRLVQPPDRVRVPTERNMHNNVFEVFFRTGAPTQVEDGNFRLNTRFLEHSSVASPPTNQRGHKPCNPHLKCCLLFLGTSDDHPVRSLFGSCLFHL